MGSYTPIVIDLQQVLSYELAPVPLSLANMDGTIRKTVKSALLKELELDCASLTSLPNTCMPENSVFIIDLLGLLQKLKKGKMVTFGDLSDYLIKKITDKFEHVNVVHVVPDRYDISLSIKAGERARRCTVNSTEIKIKGRDAKLPNSLKHFLSNSKNKINLVSFLSTDWCKVFTHILNKDQVLYFAQQDGKTQKITHEGHDYVDALYSDHEEADSRIFVHCKHFTLSSSGDKRIIISSPDTDVAILCCFHFAALKVTELWFHTGVGRQTRYVPIHTAFENLGPVLCKLLPSLHVLSGCDSTSSLYGIGKIKALSALRKNMDALQHLYMFGNSPTSVDPICFRDVKQLLGLFYGESTTDLNHLHYNMFAKKTLDSTKLPPTDDAAILHKKRANYQCYIWKSATTPVLQMPSPVGNGWTTSDDGNLLPKLMSQDPAPETIHELVICGCTKGCKTRCSCRQENLPCTPACKCADNCTNHDREGEKYDI